MQYEQLDDGLWYLVERFHDELIIHSLGFKTRAECKIWCLAICYGARKK